MELRDSTYPIHIYLLELEGGYYYVGKTRHPRLRLDQHHGGRGAEWTKLHPVVRCLERQVFYVETVYDEDRHENQLTIRWMHQMGWQRVRGGIWSEVSEGKTLSKLHRYGHFREVKIDGQGGELSAEPMVLYVLALRDGKYFVGHTRDLRRTLRKHEYGRGAEWTRKYKAVGLVEVFPVECPAGLLRKRRDVDPLVVECFGRYGAENVRGGSFSAVDEKEHLAAVARHGL